MLTEHLTKTAHSLDFAIGDLEEAKAVSLDATVRHKLAELALDLKVVQWKVDTLLRDPSTT